MLLLITVVALAPSPILLKAAAYSLINAHFLVDGRLLVWLLKQFALTATDMIQIPSSCALECVTRPHFAITWLGFQEIRWGLHTALDIVA